MSNPENESVSDPAAGVPPADQAGISQDADHAPNGEPEDDFDDYEPLTPEIVEEEAIRGDFVLKWAVVLLAVLLGSTKIGETATLLHIKAGQYMASHGVLPPATDVFSYTATDRPWTNLSWGFDLIAAAVYSIGGWIGLSAVKAIVAGVIFGLMVSVSRPGLPTWWCSICAATALLACHNRLTMQPFLVSLLGCALTFWMIDGWVREPTQRRRLWMLIPLMFVWCNLDSHAYLGLALIVLYVLGDALGAVVFGRSAIDSRARRQLALVAAGCLAVTLLHPFGWRSLCSPLLVYGTEYPALRDYIQGTYVGNSQAPMGPALLYFPLTTPTFWQNLDLASIAALVSILATVVVMLLNFRRLEPAHVAVCAGFLGLALLSIHELAAAAVVCCGLSALNGQSWYAATFRQEYSVAPSELLFSRGGRALTVLAFAAIAFFGGTGRLRDVNAPSTGFGIDHNLSTILEDFRTLLADGYDRRPFNFLLSQGDVLIWLDQQVFADSRVAVYHAADDDNNLLAKHLQTRMALRQERDANREQLTGRSRRDAWVPLFDKFQVTHVVPRLSTAVTDYAVLYELLTAIGPDDAVVPGQEWQLTGVGAVATVLYRTDLRDEDYRTFVRTHQADFRKQAYKTVPEPIAARSGWVHSPSFYQKYFWSKKRDVPPEIQQALHLSRLAAGPLPRMYDGSRAALAYAAIRQAQIGLNRDPGSPEGYVALGQAYEMLANWEAAIGGRNSGLTPYSGPRYLQAVSAYNQALVAEPTFLSAHRALVGLYSGAQRIDLMLRHVAALDRQLTDDPRDSSEDMSERVDQMERLRTAADQVEQQLDRFANQGAEPFQLAQAAYQRGCLLSALKRLDAAPAGLAGNLAAEQLRILILLESGRAEEALEASDRWSGPARSSRLQNWQDVAALCQLPNAGYDQAAELWLEEAQDVDQQILARLLGNLPPRTEDPRSPLAWPAGTLAGAVDYFTQRPMAISQYRLSAALSLLEQGQLSRAEKTLSELLEQTPDSVHRPLVAHYLFELTGKPQDLYPPSAWVPILFADDDESPPKEER